ncbi:hypothetical protein L1987_37079 [Smallanthus sonchifolius]|uniref:Uncharacterized protein n=1 Tax=Smallanthus sonchifolius TaxID=185202 RepID=A0ACB9HFT9_9ASTR|nr:hypothetical protein L1987_37079 [Smallanthus sonchifolius]
MLSHNIESKQVNKDEGQSMGGGGGRSNTPSLKPPEQILKCPRCDSSNTKFCYYNNYSLTQPRHFCKACRRYWTKGGALRNIPIGGTCKKIKKSKSYSSKCSSSDMGGMKFFGLSTLDFQLGGLNFSPRVTTASQLSSSYGDTSSNHSLVNLDPLGYNIPPFSSSHQQQQHNNNNQNGGFHEMGTCNQIHHNTDLASSIESLSSINQDLHWKLQQQRLAMLFGGGEINGQQHQNKEQVLESHRDQKLQPILFQNLETAKPGQSSMATEWFFDNGYAPENPNPATSTNSNGAGNDDQNGSISNWNGIQAWNQLNQ